MKINWTYFVFLLSALVLLTLSIFSYYRFEQQKISSALVNQTYLVKSKLEEAFGTLIDADAGQRGYLLTRDSIFLKQFLSSKSVLLQIAHELDSLVVDPGQKNNLKEFHRLVGRRINGLDGVFDSAQRSNTSQPGTFLIQSKLVSDTVRNHIAYIEKQEDILLSLRINEDQKQEKKTSTFILIFSLFSLAILVYSFFRLKKESKLLSKSEYNAELLEQKVNERTAEIKKINQRLHDQNLELERKNADLASFTFVASHDLKEPLRKIEIFADKIIRTEQQLTEKGKKYFDRIISSASRMKNLIDSVSQFAQTNAFYSDFMLTDLNETAARAIENLQENIAEKNAVIEYSNLPTVNAISDHMEQLFTNLIGNAIKYSKEGITPIIKIDARKMNAGDNENPLACDVWKIDFADNGIGFDERFLEKIFQMFQRLHTKDAYSGTGIGLAICKKIAENHQGAITAKSTPRAGSTFSIFLPKNQ